MAGWTQKVPGRGACALVDAAARMAASLLREFPAEVAAHLALPLSSLRRPRPHCPAHTRNHLEIVMKLVLDQTACQGYGLCQQAAPDLVDLDDWGYAGLLGDGSVPGGQQRPRARRPSRSARSRR